MIITRKQFSARCVCVLSWHDSLLCAPIAKIVIVSRFVTTISLKIRWTQLIHMENLQHQVPFMNSFFRMEFARVRRHSATICSPSLTLAIIFAVFFFVGFSSIFFSHLRFVYIILHSLIEVSTCCNDPNIANGPRMAVVCVWVRAGAFLYLCKCIYTANK